MSLIKVSGGKLVDQSGKTVFLQGGNMSGLENSTIQAWNPDPWADDGGTPKWSEYAKWKPNAVRIPLNAACFLNLTVAKTVSATAWGTPWNADKYGNYRQAIKDAIDAARAIGCYVIFDLHWCAPKVTLGGVTNYLAPMAQSPFADKDTGLPFWKAFVLWLQSTYPAGINDIIFELFNEPFLDSFSSGLADRDAALKIGGTSTRIVNGTQGGANYELAGSWALAGYQEILDSIRALGATNVVIVNGNSYTQSLQQWQKYLPIDSLGQVVFGWHPYPHGTYPYSNGDVYGKTGSDAGAGTANFAQWALAIKKAGYPVLITEDGGRFGPTATSGEPHIDYMTNLAVKSLDGYIAWQWNGTQTANSAGNFFMTQYLSDGKTIVPSQGMGVQINKFFLNNATSGGPIGVPTMTDLVTTVVYADVPGFPQGSAVDHILVTLTEAAGASSSQSVAPGTTSVSFASVAPGTYTASVQAFPATGAGYGSVVVSNPITVAAPVTISLSLPSAATLA